MVRRVFDVRVVGCEPFQRDAVELRDEPPELERLIERQALPVVARLEL